MPEDAGVNGDAWNDEASLLFKQFNWKPVGDSNIDVVNEDGKDQGLDRMFTYLDTKKNSRLEQGVFVEAKCYKTTSFQKDYLAQWISTLDKKLTKAKNSEKFQEKFPSIGQSILNTGVIVIWFSNIEEYYSFKSSFDKAKVDVKAPNRQSSSTPNKIYVLDNRDILRLCSVVRAIEEYNKEKDTSLSFYYPSSDYYNNAITRTDVLTLDFMYSQFILAESKVNGIENRVVFYFGELSTNAFKRLKSVLQTFSFLDKDKPLIIYRYKRDQEFRKYIPDIEELFKISGIDLKMEEMEIFFDLPVFLRKNK